jgi:hypothetical protein
MERKKERKNIAKRGISKSTYSNMDLKSCTFASNQEAACGNRR